MKMQLYFERSLINSMGGVGVVGQKNGMGGVDGNLGVGGVGP